MNAQLDMIAAAADYADELPPGTVLLHGQYVIESYLVRGGFGITYLARDSLDRIVVIKECFPGAICCRVDGQVQARSHQRQDQLASVLRHFIREARRLSKLRHPDIVGVHQVFEERNTAYMALDFVNGSDLLTILEEDDARLQPHLVQDILRRTLQAVSYIHDQGILHRDISPDNILLDTAGNPTLIDFGAAREHATRENRALSALLTVKDGYSPQEFYLSDEPQRPSSDLYSLGATFYHVIAGEAPPQSQQRLAAVASRGEDPYKPLAARVTGYDSGFLAAIDKSLEIFPDDRFQSAAEWIDEIDRCRDAAGRDARQPGEASILRAVSELIEDTAGYFAKATSAPAEPAPARPAADTEPDGSEPEGAAGGDRRFVDIFGNPIEDVDAWLEAQEAERLRRSRKSTGAESAREIRVPAARGGFLRGWLNRKPQRDAASYEN